MAIRINDAWFTALAVIVLGGALMACKRGKKEQSSAPVATATATATASAKPADVWKKLEPGNADFEVIGPASFEKSTQSTPSALGDIETTIYTASFGSSAYQLAHTDYPAKIIKAGNAKKLLKASEDAALEKVLANSTGSSELTVQGHPGREFTATFQKEGINGDYAGRMILVKNRLYHLQVVSALSKASDEDKKKFFDSFKLLKGAK